VPEAAEPADPFEDPLDCPLEAPLEDPLADAEPPDDPGPTTAVDASLRLVW
jgi:hypothetical protein